MGKVVSLLLKQKNLNNFDILKQNYRRKHEYGKLQKKNYRRQNRER